MMSVCTSCCQPRLPRACFPLSSLVILLSSNNQASIPKIPIKRCPPPSLPNIDLLHHHAASITPGLFSTQGSQNHLKWPSFSLRQCAQFSRPSPAAFCLSALPFACLLSSCILAFLPSGSRFTQAPLQRMFSCHFSGSNLIHFLNLSSKVSSREAFSIPRVSCTYSLCGSTELAIPPVNSPFIVSHSRLSPYYRACSQTWVNRAFYVLLYYADFRLFEFLTP